MRPGNIISRILCLPMMLLMLLSITPKSYLHDIIAGHTDVISCHDSIKEGPCMHRQGYNCDISDVVVSGAYLADALPAFEFNAYTFSTAPAPYYSFELNHSPSSKQSRGPPFAYNI